MHSWEIDKDEGWSSTCFCLWPSTMDWHGPHLGWNEGCFLPLNQQGEGILWGISYAVSGGGGKGPFLDLSVYLVICLQSSLYYFFEVERWGQTAPKEVMTSHSSGERCGSRIPSRTPRLATLAELWTAVQTFLWESRLIAAKFILRAFFFLTLCCHNEKNVGNSAINCLMKKTPSGSPRKVNFLHWQVLPCAESVFPKVRLALP